MKFMTIIRSGHAIILTDSEIEKAYRAKEKQYAIKDAEKQLKFFFGIEEDTEPETEGYREFESAMGFSLEKACDEHSENYMLSDLAEEFLENHDCNIADNLQWDDIISRYCSEIGREVPA